MQAAVAETLRRFGQIDVLVNNAGSAVEEDDGEEACAVFEAHFFGEVNLIFRRESRGSQPNDLSRRHLV